MVVEARMKDAQFDCFMMQMMGMEMEKSPC
jgi:hypothetical protein